MAENILSEAMAAADAAGAQDGQDTGTGLTTQQQGEEAVGEALSKSMAPIFNTHSQALAGRLIAEEKALINIVGDIDRRIAELNAERDDAMLAHSGISKALGALQQ